MLESWFEGSGGFDETDYEAVGKNVSVLCVRRKAMVGADKGDFEEFNGRVVWERGSELFDVKRSVDYGDTVVCSFFDLKG